MKATLFHAQSVLTVHLNGPLDHSAGSQWQQLIDDIRPFRVDRVVIDLSEVERIDSVGLGMLHLIRDDLTAAGTALTLRGLGPVLRRLFDLTGCIHVFEIE